MVVKGTHAYYINGEAAGTSGSGIALPGAADTADRGHRQDERRHRAEASSGMIDDVRSTIAV